MMWSDALMVVVEVEIVTLAKERHPLKVASSMLLTDAGMAPLVNALQLPKAKIPILVTGSASRRD